MSQRALVIGGTGFLGRAIVQELRAVGWAVTCLARGRQPHALADVPLLVADRSQPGELARLTRGYEFDLVVDCAAFQGDHVAEAIAAFAGRVQLYVFISTDFVYAASPNLIYPVKEDASKQYELPYAVGKLDCETILIRAWEEQQFPAIMLRPPHIVGAGRALGCDPLVMRENQLLARMRAGQELTLVAEGQLLIQPAWNREVGLCIAHLALHAAAARSGDPTPYGQIFNCAGPEAVTTQRYYEIIAEYLGVPLRFTSVPCQDFIRQVPDKAHMARHRIYDLTALKDRARYRPHLSLRDAIYDTARWADQQVAA